MGFKSNINPEPSRATLTRTAIIRPENAIAMDRPPNPNVTAGSSNHESPAPEFHAQPRARGPCQPGSRHSSPSCPRTRLPPRLPKRRPTSPRFCS
ncbi:hypothetical protein BCR44DRAFT_65745 [Catenaria anguillulae PL171]|uniref:Uncharacterized protein n=1 Tax=Catenaria anguillulae PL171 TaxID=765915 RepID=A0A1Y2HX49_9FUNG|nr:hypothetical protein BCR44DRAFT_65745 [Catenaria anguillulae PL171]